MIKFVKAERRRCTPLICLVGGAGSGKTLSAIYIARGFVGPEGRFGIADSESGRAGIYAGICDPWGHALMDPPFDAGAYIDALDSAEEAKLNALIIDSVSHEWDGVGGILEQADEGKTKAGKEMQGLAKWAKPKAAHRRWMQRLLTSKIPLIVLCARSKERLRQVGKDIVSDGVACIQEKGFEYEMTASLEMRGDGRFIHRKCPEDLRPVFDSSTPITVETGEQLRKWAEGT